MHQASPPGGRLAAYALALLLAGLAFAARLALAPVFGSDHTFTVFYPVVILTAYFLGARPAIAAAGVSVVLAYWAFLPPQMSWKTDFASLATVLFFTFTSAVSIYFITGMAKALRQVAEARARAEELALSHADLFGELNERVTNHLQLVAALLQLQARDEADESVARALAEASTRTLLISRVHRSVAGDTNKTLDFDSFARGLIEAMLSARGHDHLRVEVVRAGTRLPLDQATSVAIVLLECLKARADVEAPATVSVRLVEDGLEAKLEVTETWDAPGPSPDLAKGRRSIEAMVEQLGGRFSVTSGAGSAVSALVFPHPDPARAGVVQSAATRTVH